MSLRAIIQFLVILIGVIFESIRMGQGKMHPFILINYLNIPESEFIGTSEWFRPYVYYLCEHIKFITISLMMCFGSKAEDFKTDRLFVILAMLDLLDYIFWGNNIWGSITLVPHINGFGLILPLSMNVFTLLVFGGYVLVGYVFGQWKMNGQRV